MSLLSPPLALAAQQGPGIGCSGLVITDLLVRCAQDDDFFMYRAKIEPCPRTVRAAPGDLLLGVCVPLIQRVLCCESVAMPR